MTENERKIVEELNHPLYTPEFIEQWEDWKGNVFSNAPAALQSMGVIEAIKQIAKLRETED